MRHLLMFIFDSYRFIRDPSETDFHPLQEMVERPLKSQLSKISVSFVVYTVITFGTLAPLFYGTLAMNWLAVVAGMLTLFEGCLLSA